MDKKKPVTLLRGKNGIAVIARNKLGKGEIWTVGVSPLLFGSSERSSRVLQNFYRELCRQHDLELETDGVLHLRRGNYHLVYAFERSFVLKGLFLDILAEGLPLLKNPRLQKRTPWLLLDVSELTRGRKPSLLFASHRLIRTKISHGNLEFVVEGPERIPAEAQIYLGNSKAVKLQLARLKSGASLQPLETRLESPYLYLKFPNYEGGVLVRVLPE